MKETKEGNEGRKASRQEGRQAGTQKGREEKGREGKGGRGADLHDEHGLGPPREPVLDHFRVVDAGRPRRFDAHFHHQRPVHLLVFFSKQPQQMDFKAGKITTERSPSEAPTLDRFTTKEGQVHNNRRRAAPGLRANFEKLWSATGCMSD